MNILKNKFFFVVVIIFIFCFSIVLYLGMNKIYEKEITLFLKGLVSHSENILQAYLLDTHGNEVLHADKGGTSKVHEHLLQGLVTKKTVSLENPITFIPIFKQGNSKPMILATLSLSTISKIKDQIKANQTVIHALIALTDWRDPETGEHLTRTRKYSAMLAKNIKNIDRTFRSSRKGFF